MAGFTVVCDRFVYDNLVEVMVDINDSKLHEKLVGRLILKLTPKSSLQFFLDADEKTVFLRKQDIPNLRYFTCRRNNYRLISRDLNIVTVDAEGSFECIQKHLAR
jgi:thymidylate kinase